MLYALTVLSATVVSWFDRPDSRPTSIIQASCDALFREFSDAQRAYNEGTHKAKTKENARKFSRPDGARYAARFMAMAREHPDDPAAADALSRVILVDFAGPYWKEAIALIGSRHVQSTRVGPALERIAFDTTPPPVEPLLRAVLEQNPSAEVRVRAAFALARHLRRLAGEADNLRTKPDRFASAIAQFGRDDVTRMRDRDPGALRRESEALFGRVVRDGTGGAVEEARAELRSIRELVPGAEAPDIEGLDVDGKSLRLSDFRGKVVVLVFWATWCPPCMAMVPHERAMVRRLEGQPFVLLGVNGDESRERLKYQVSELDIHWRSWYDGGPDGPISNHWNVKSWPTVFVIDSGGVIRYKGGRDEAQLDAAVSRLVHADH